MPPEETTQPETIPEAVPDKVTPEVPVVEPVPPAEESPITQTETIPEQVTPVETPPTPQSSQPPQTPEPTPTSSPSQPQPEPPQQPPTLRTKLSLLLQTARNLIQNRRNQKLEKIVTFVLNQKAKGKSVANDEVEKLLHVSDKTATRYLNILVKQGRLKRSGEKKGTTYEIQG